jgi:plastocyanin
MHLSSTLFGLIAFAAVTVQAQAGTTIQVTVGADGKLQYNPNNIIAAVGTNVVFSFFPKVCNSDHVT